MIDGVLNVNKPSGVTSHDVVQHVRRVFGQKRVGHTGTLDPLASGVLVLCLGKATRIARFLEAGEKEYQASLKLGITTDTLDAEGRIMEKRMYIPPKDQEIIDALRQFTGHIMQTPPAYSAIKVRGVPSYKLARSGKDEPHKPRPVTISAVELVLYDNPTIIIRVRCSKGVYIRALCADLGKTLGSGAHMTRLTRTRSGRFVVDESISLDQLDALPTKNLNKAVMPIDRALDDIPAVALNQEQAGRIAHGNRIQRMDGADGNQTGLVRAHDQAGKLIALTRVEAGELWPEVVFS